ncbi:unnamed protein product, partial [marine sediment metagenome]
VNTLHKIYNGLWIVLITGGSYAQVMHNQRPIINIM